MASFVRRSTLFLYLICFGVAAESSNFTLEQVLAIAAEKSDELAIIEKRTESGYAEVDIYRAEAYPMVSFATGVSYVNQSLSGQPFQNELMTLFDRLDGGAFNWGLNLQQPLLTFGKVRSALKLAKSREKSLVTLKRLERDRVFLGVMELFASAYSAQRDHELAEKAVERSGRLHTRVRSDFEFGRVSRRDYLRIEALLQRDRAQLIASSNLLKTTARHLAVMIGLDDSTVFTLYIDEKGAFSRPPQNQVSTNMLLALKEEEGQLYEEQGKYFRAGAFPSLYLVGSIANQFMAIDTSGMTGKALDYLSEKTGQQATDAKAYFSSLPKAEKYFDPDFFNYTIGVQLSWNIFDGKRTWAQYKQAKLNFEKAQRELQLIKKRNDVEMEEARNRVTAIDSMAVAVRLQVEAAQKALEQVEIDYKDGITDITTFLEADSEFREAAKQYDLLKVQKMLAIAHLRFVMGLPVYGE